MKKEPMDALQKTVIYRDPVLAIAAFLRSLLQTSKKKKRLKMRVRCKTDNTEPIKYKS